MNLIKTFFKRKDYIIVVTCLTIAILGTLFIIWPQSKEFTAIGGIVPVQELGIDGSVNFTYVESGITTNRYEELLVFMHYDDVSFIPLTDEEVYYLEDYYSDETDEYKEETIENAVVSAFVESNPYGFSEEFSYRIQEIIEYSEGYYGDSMGLMSAIGLIEEMNNQDYSKQGKYIIAGTGTMEVDQTVGSVGAIREKLLTASLFNVDYFFIPKDKDYYDDIRISNEVEAERVLKEENLSLNVVPVATLNEAIHFLENLP